MWVKYKCNQCPVEAEVEVPKRHIATDLMLWMNIVGQKVADDHLARTGENHGTCSLAIPFGGAEDEMVGRPSEDTISKARGTAFPTKEDE